MDLHKYRENFGECKKAPSLGIGIHKMFHVSIRTIGCTSLLTLE